MRFGRKWLKINAFFPLATEGCVITYEYPFNERIRTLLRLEDLFDKTHYFACLLYTSRCV